MRRIFLKMKKTVFAAALCAAAAFALPAADAAEAEAGSPAVSQISDSPAISPISGSPENAYRVRVNVSYPAPQAPPENIAATEVIEPFAADSPVLSDPAVPVPVVSEPQKILAAIGGEPITEEDVLGELWERRGRETFDWLVGRALLRRELRRLALEINDREVADRLEAHLGVLRRAFPGLTDADGLTRVSAGLGLAEYRERTVWVEIAIRKIMRAKSRPSEEKLRQFYAEIRAEFIRPESVRLSQVFIPPQPAEDADGMTGAEDWARAERQIMEADSRLRMRENFADVARAYGTGGQLSRRVERGELLRELEAAAFSILPGAITTPIRTSMGYHILTVEEKEERVEPAFEDVRAEVLERYREGEFLATAGEFLADLKERALRDGTLDLSGAEEAFRNGEDRDGSAWR